MKRIFLLFFLLGCFYSKQLFAQACGSGLFQLQLEDAACDAHYDLFQLKEILDLPHQADLYGGYFIDSTAASKLMLLPPEARKLPAIIANNNLLKGAVVNKQVSFHTLERYNKPLLLKIISQKRTYFLLGMFLGGCNRTAVVYLEKKSVQLKKQQ